MDFICENDFIRALAVKRSLSYLIRLGVKTRNSVSPEGNHKAKKIEILQPLQSIS